MIVPIEVSARHIHLTKNDIEILFGKNYLLKIVRKISQPGQFAAQETVDVISSKKRINNVRILGPAREKTQLEISLSDAYELGLKVPVRQSGDLAKSAGKVTIIGPKGKINLVEGVIIAARHLHIEPALAKKYNIKDKQIVAIEISGTRALIFNRVLVRSRKGLDKLSFQIDVDEANAAGVTSGCKGKLII